MHPVAYNASCHRWQMFITLTYASADEHGNRLRVPDETARQKMLFAFLRAVAEGLKRSRQTTRRIETVRWADLLWVAREERGELNGRHHYHILLDGLPPSRLNTTERFAIKAIWTDKGGGFADVRSFDTRLSGVRYVMKGLKGWTQTNANAYEMRKFGEDHEDRRLILADACVRKWAAHRAIPRASEGAHPEFSAVRSVGRREAAIQRAKETTEKQLRQSIGLNMHPAGVSFVR